MSEWWLKLLGVDAARIPEGATTEFVFTHAPRSWWVFIALAAVGVMVWGVFAMYRREQVAASARARWSLAALRAAVLLLIVTALLGPALAVATHRTIEPYVIVLVDESLSMSIKDRYADTTEAQRVAELTGRDITDVQAGRIARADVVNLLLNPEQQRLISDLRQRGKVRIMTFARSVTLRQTLRSTTDEARGDGEAEAAADPADADTSLEQGDPVPPLTPMGQATNLANAVREALRSLGGNPVAGIVIITDGQNTEGDDPLSAADVAATLNVPLFTIGVGDSSEPRNLKVAELWAPDSVFRDDPFLVQAQIQAEGFAGRTVDVALEARPVRADGSAGADLTLQTRQVTFAGDTADERITFEHRPSEAGDYVFSVRVSPLPNEVLESDNVKSLPVKVLSDQARVLLIAGSPSWEYRMVSTLLKRDKTVNLSCWLQSIDADMLQEGNTVIDHLPASPEELFQYDVVMFFDPDPAEFNEAWIEALRQFLGDHAGGVMWVAGPKYTAKFLTIFRTRDMLDLLPVRIGQLTALDIETLVMTHPKEWPLRVTPAGVDHVMMRLDKDPAVNRRMWEVMPGIYWSFPTRSAKAGSQVLIEHSDPRLRTRDGARPLLVTGQFGPGRTVFMGFNGTWRWRKVGEQYFDQYWIQAVRFLTEGRLLGAKKRGRLATDRDVYPVGQRVQVTAQLYDAAFRPLEQETIAATLRGPGGTASPFELRPIANEPGSYEGAATATQVGMNEVVVMLGGADGLVRVAKQINVEVPQVEFADPRLNRQLLTAIADRTSGRYFDVNQTAELLELVPQRTETIVIKGRPVELWDTSRLLILLIVLLTVEWAMRKRLKMM